MDLNVIFQSVSRMWPAAAVPAPRIYASRHLDYLRFKVTDENIALKLADWRARDQTARAAVEGYLNQVLPPSRCATKTFYRMADDGYLRDVAYNGYVPEGWHTQADEDKDRAYHWVEPKSAAVMRVITQMPPAPSRRELAGMVGWPYLETAGQREDLAILYQSVNHALRVCEEAGDVLLDVPLCDNFNACPDIRAVVEGWRVPAGLKPLAWLRPPRGLRLWPLKIEIPAAF